MKLKMTLALVAIIGLGSTPAFAQKASVKDIDAEGDTTISISKGSPKTQDHYQITDGTAEIEGEPEILSKAARDSWKKACAEWKNETKDLNKENQVMAISCNKPTCTKNEASATVCQSTGSYKIKTKMN